MTTPIPVFGRVEPPPVDRRDIPPDVNTAWDDLGPRRPRFAVIHRMLGTLAGTDRYFRTEARHHARTDYGIDHQSGAVWRWTDPLGRHAPWASGPYDDPSALGRALVVRFGLATVNRDGVSIEVAGMERDAISGTALDAVARLVAFWADWAGVPHDRWPINPETGVAFVARHEDFAAKACPFDALRTLIPAIERRAGEVLRAAQVDPVAPRPVPPPSAAPRPAMPAPPTALVLPPDVTVERLGDWFGRITSNGEKALTYAFDPDGPVSALWLARGHEQGVWPQLAQVLVEGETRWFRFEDGWTVRATRGAVEAVAA